MSRVKNQLKKLNAKYIQYLLHLQLLVEYNLKVIYN